MMTMKKKGTILLLTCVLLLALAFTLPGAAADGTDTVSGSTSASTTFYVYANGSGYIKLYATKGTAYVADYNSYGNLTGYRAEEDYGFFRVQVTKTGYSKTYVWAPSATMNTFGVETSRSMIITFPGYGDYKIVVTPLSPGEVNGTYWARNRLQYWMSEAVWTVSAQVNCSCRDSGSIGVQPQGGTVTVYCYDTAGNYISTYTETLTGSGTIYPKSLSGYTASAASASGQYIRVQNGTCSPAAVTFYYQKANVSAKLTVYCYDTTGVYLRSYTETLTSNRTVTPQEIDGYTALTPGQYVTCSGGVCTPAAITFIYQKKAVAVNVTVYCYDTDGNYIRTYTETIDSSQTLYPRSISGYTIASSGQNITVVNGTCSPSTVTFRYRKIVTTGTVTVTCRDNRGGILRTYTESVTGSKTITPPAISGYTTTSSALTVTCENGRCTPAQVDFYYNQNPAPVTPTPTPVPAPVTPTPTPSNQGGSNSGTVYPGSNDPAYIYLDTYYSEYPYYKVESFQPNGYCYLYDRTSDINGRNLGRHENGELVKVLSHDPSGWYQVVCSNGKQGYIHDYVLTPYEETLNRDTCVVNSTEPNGYCYMYNAPSSVTGQNMGRYNNGEVFEVVNWYADDNYAQVYSPRTQKYGYVRKGCLTFNYGR